MAGLHLISWYSTVDTRDSAGHEIADIINFDVPNKMMLTKKSNYKPDVSIRNFSNILGPVIRVYDKRGRPHLVRKSFTSPEGRQEIKSLTSICYTSAFYDHSAVCGKIVLLLRLGHLRVPVRVYFVDKRPALILIGTWNIDWFIKGILPMERMIVPFHPGPVAKQSAYTYALK